MRWLVLMCLIISVSASELDLFQQRYATLANEEHCISDQEVTAAFSAATLEFSTHLCKKASHLGSYHLIISPLSIWLTLAAIAEECDQYTQNQLFQILNLPRSLCSRQKFYHIATSRISPSQYVSISNIRALVIDSHAHINPYWYNFVKQNSLLDVIPAPIKYDAATTSGIIKQIMLTNVGNLDFSGNSVLLNSMDFNGLWTTAFANAVVQRAPFYDRDGYHVGSVDLMRVRRRVRVGYIRSLNSKVIEMPIGLNGEYRMIFGLVVDKIANLESVVTAASNASLGEALASLQESYKPIDVAIPRVQINCEVDVKELLEKEMGIKSLWRDPSETRFISTPPAQPSSYIQRTTLILNNAGIHPAPPSPPSYHYASDEERYWSEFIADRPFLFALFDAETYTCLLWTLYSQPTYPY